MTSLLKLPPESLKDAELQLSYKLIRTERERRSWSHDPAAWAKARLGASLWSGQRRIMESVATHRNTAVATCHSIGKTFSAAGIAAWWIDIHALGQAFVISTAPTNDQVRILLWKEIGRAWQRGGLVGRVNQTEWKATVKDPNTGREKEETIGIGRKPNDYTPTAFQGVHAPFVLVIVDEANGVRGPLHHALDSMTANENSKKLMIGNPDDPTGEFYEACLPGSGWNVIHISAFDSPNFTGEELPKEIKDELIGFSYVEEKRKKWAPSWTWTPDRSKCEPPADGKLEDTHPFWQSKVLGQFPVQTAEGSLIALTWIRAAQSRELTPGEPNEIGLDVGASEGGDPSCLGHRRGQVFRVLYEERQPDTMKTTGKLLRYLADAKIGASKAKVDYIGVGRGVVDRAKEQGLPVFPISVGEASTVFSCRICKTEWDQNLVPRKRLVTHQVRCPKCNSDQAWTVFANLLSQLWWEVRGMFERGEIDIDQQDNDLADELLTLRWEPNSKGQIVVKYGDGPSPNRADSLLITFAPTPVEVTHWKEVGMTSEVTW